MKRYTLVAILFFLSSSVIARNVCNCKGNDDPGGPCYAEPGGPAYAGPGGPAYKGPGGACYEGEGGPCYSGPGGGWNCPSVCSKCTAVKQEKFEDQLLQD